MSKTIIYTIGIGNDKKHITLEAKEILSMVDVIAGHFGFVEMSREFINPRALIIDDRPARARAKTYEDYQKDRISMVINQALDNKSVAVLSGGDAGLWGMAGVFLEAQKEFQYQFDVKVIPGIPSLTSIAAKIGAPLQNGFTVISIGDEDMPFDLIEKRLMGAAYGGGVIVLFKLILENIAYPQYYPKEKYPDLYPPEEQTRYRLQRTYDILKEHIPPDRTMIIVTDAYDQTSNYSTNINMLGSKDGKEVIEISQFGKFLEKSSDFRFLTTVIIGDSMTKTVNTRVLTPQWNYKWNYSNRMLNEVTNLSYLKTKDSFFCEKFIKTI